MLVVKVTMTEGRTLEQKEALIRWSSDAAEELGWPLEEVREAIYEVSKDGWGLAGSSVVRSLTTFEYQQRVQAYLEYARSGTDSEAETILGGGRPDLDESCDGNSICSAGSQGPVCGTKQSGIGREGGAYNRGFFTEEERMSEQQANAEVSTKALARRLDEAWEGRKPIPPLSESDGLEAMEQAYAIQTSWSEMRLERGERIIGRKIGLTSKGMQEQMGVNEPDYGSLWASRYFPAQGGRVEIPTETFLQPRLEGEIAFLISKPLAGESVTPQEVLAATEALAVAVEVVDSRIEDWNIKLADTIADNASYGGFTLGPWSRSLREADLRTLGMLINKSGSRVAEGLGAASLGHPARAVAWLARKLTSFGVSLRPGDFVLSGALSGAVPVEKGDVFVLEIHSQPPLTVTFT